MEKFIINGSAKLSGSIDVSGAKNAILPIMAACMLAKGKSTLTNVPALFDLKTMSHLLRIIGARVDHNDDVMTIDAEHCSFFEAPYELVSKMRASFYVMGPLIARFGQAHVSFPGGCAIGTRPVDLHLLAFEEMGVDISLSNGYVNAKCDELKGAHIKFPISSVGATANTIMAATLAKGTTVIENAAMEPEIASLINFLTLMGAKISGIDTTTITIEGVKELHPATMPMMADRIEAGTFMLAAAITKSVVTVRNCQKEHLTCLIQKMEEAGCQFKYSDNDIVVIPPDVPKSVDIITEPYPGYPTDLQAQFLAYMTLASGVSRIEDTIFPDRFMHVGELERLGAKVKMEKNVAYVHGVEYLSGAEIMATDLRASAALLLAGLAARETTTISRIYHIDRGYDKIEEKFRKIGVNIKRALD